MLLDDVEWKDEYKVGVDIIDNAHREFFRVARRILIASSNKKPNRWAAMEGVKFLKAYAVRHFNEEEQYMQSIGYKDLQLHKAQHEFLKTKLVPRIEGYVQKHGESAQAVRIFVDVLMLWIKRHILIHDKAIGWHDPAENDDNAS